MPTFIINYINTLPWEWDIQPFMGTNNYSPTNRGLFQYSSISLSDVSTSFIWIWSASWAYFSLIIVDHYSFYSGLVNL